MKIKASLLLLIILVSFSAVSQKSKILEDHYKNEWKTLKEFVRYSEESIPDTNIDVKFYYLDLEIDIDSVYMSGIVKCIFEPVVADLDQAWISLNSALRVSDVSGDVSDYLQTGDSILINLDASYNPGDLVEVVITYAGVPKEAGG